MSKNEEVRAIYNQIEYEMLEEAFQELGKFSSVEDHIWKRQKLLALRNINGNNKKIIQKYVGDINMLTDQMLKKEYSKTINRVDDAFSQINRSINSDMDHLKYRKFSEQAQKQLLGMDRSLLQNFNSTYRRSVIKVQSLRNVGLITRGEAVAKITKEWANQGTPAIIYKNGRAMNSSSYADMLLRTEANNVQELALRDRMGDFGEDLVISSQHHDSSNLCQPYQNRIMSLSGKNKKYISFENAKSDGYKHPNCKHLEFPYFPGVSEKEPVTASKREVEKDYDNLLKQRRLEREVRKSKYQELAAINNKNLPIEERKKLIDTSIERKKYYQAQLREHTAKSGRTREYSRESIKSSPEQLSFDKKRDRIVSEELARSRKIEPQITKDLKSAGANLEGLDHKFKSEASYRRKLADELVENPDLEIASSKIRDKLRYTSINSVDNFYNEYNRMYNNLTNDGYKFTSIKNTFKKGQPYKGVNTLLKRGNFEFELQFHTKHSYSLKSGKLHELYEEYRSTGTPLWRQDEIDTEMKKLSESIKLPKNVDKIK